MTPRTPPYPAHGERYLASPGFDLRFSLEADSFAPFPASLPDLARLWSVALAERETLLDWTKRAMGPRAAPPYMTRPQHFLYFFPLPHRHGSLGPAFVAGPAGVGAPRRSRVRAFR